MLTSLVKVLKKAQRGKYAVGAFNTNNLEFTQAIIEAAVELKSPVIIQTSEKAIKYAGLEEFVCMVSIEAKKTEVPVVLHFDHGRDLEMLKKCLDAGYTSVMFDGSNLPYNQNVSQTEKVVAWARAKKVAVEAELGALLGQEDDVKSRESFIPHLSRISNSPIQQVKIKGAGFMTNPAQAADFVRKTGIDALAVSIGNAHGLPLPEEKLDFERLTAISKKVKIPLVLHGASKGIPPRDIRKAISLGICKINIDTDLRLAFSGAIRKILKERKGVYDPREILAQGREAVKKIVRKKILLFGSKGKA